MNLRNFLLRTAISSLTLAVPALVGCGGSEPAEPAEPGQEELLAPPEAGKGVQFKMVTKLDPGTEGEHCMFVKAPAEGLYVNRDEVRFTKGSHHFLLYQTTYEDIPTKKDDGTVVDTSGVFDCSDGATNGWAVEKLIGGSQNGEGEAFLKFPEGVAMKVRPGAVLLMNAHYINATMNVIEPEVRINLYSVPEAEVTTEGDVLFLYNPFIHVAPMGEGRARMRCPVHKDITIVNIQSHMHARGVDYSASLVGQAEPFYTNTEWEKVPVKDFGAGLEVKAGSWFDYHCDYSNGEMRDVYQGPRSTDEMCMLIGSYYPAEAATANCLAEPSVPGQPNYLGAEWVGNGKATCAESFSCVQQAIGSGTGGIEAWMPCVTNSDEAVAKELSDALRCFIRLGPGQNPAEVCKTEFETCLAK
ncbi:hypothetical protein [Polyangium jinanense]|uniref:Copper type II ascorbate-dependent monooxygenase C-terminal domain-containing protein n=1 Tax=Polyangium jinanense TaxID=2829994 RepID=A0A9X4AQR7_9BACT|nr:hypothetical protein [Polyangium jinanense]MDC3954862.1 hypothetical protein [Polyangium jinanense]MDC3981368.1 hypothetical protein [Polyangium jinanense]